MLGTANGLMWIPYQTRTAHGWTSLAVLINIIAVTIIVFGILWNTTPRYGAEGAAWVWVSLNAGYVLIGIHFMYRRILSTEKWKWYIHDLMLPLGTGTAVAIPLKIVGIGGNSIFSQLTLLLLAFLMTSAASLLSAGGLVRQLQKMIDR